MSTIGGDSPIAGAQTRSGRRRGPPAALIVVALLCSACSFLPPPVPPGAYYPDPREAQTVALAQTLHRAAQAAGDDPTRYSFALVQTHKVTAVSAPDAVFYFSEGLAALPGPHLDALVAQAVAHEILGHGATRRAVSRGITVGFTAAGLVMGLLVVPGLGLADFVVNPLVVGAFSRDQELTADRKALEILEAMGHPAPRRVLAAALEAAASVNGPSKVWAPLAEHPPLATRLAALEPLELPAWAAEDQPPSMPLGVRWDVVTATGSATSRTADLAVLAPGQDRGEGLEVGAPRQPPWPEPVGSPLVNGQHLAGITESTDEPNGIRLSWSPRMR